MIREAKRYLQNYGLVKILRMIVFMYYMKYRRPKTVQKENVKIKIAGSDFCVIPNDIGKNSISTELLLFGAHEPLFTDVLLNELNEGMIFLDVGSNIGYYACLVSKKVGKKGKVIAIEPSPLNFRYLKNNVALQPVSNTETFNLAASDKNGEVDFEIMERSNMCRVVEENAKPLVKYNDSIKIITVPVKRLDSFLEEIDVSKIDVVLVDVEGHELNVYRGMSGFLTKYKPKLMIEIHKMHLGVNHTLELLKNLKNDGYEVEYYVPRSLDYPTVGSKKDVKKLTINDLLEKIRKNSIPDVFLVFLFPRF